MLSEKSQAAVLAALTATVLACTGGPSTGPAAVEVESRLDLTSGPSELPNVIRFEEEGGVGVIADPGADLLLLVGLPEDPADAFDCGGTEPFDQIATQVIGVLTGVFKVLAKSDPHLHVYQLSSFTGLCSSAPFAQGSGRLVVNDNDAGVSGTRTNSFGASVNGAVALAAGGSAILSAHVRFLIFQDGTFVEATSEINLGR